MGGLCRLILGYRVSTTEHGFPNLHREDICTEGAGAEPWEVSHAMGVIVLEISRIVIQALKYRFVKIRRNEAASAVSLQETRIS